MLKILLTPNATQLFLCFFESKQETHNLSKKTTFCNTLLFFLWCFCKKALRVQCRKAFSIPKRFSMGLRARDRTGHVIIVATTKVTEP